MSALEDVSGEEGEQEAPPTEPAMPPMPVTAAHRAAGKHIRDGGEEIGRPALMRSGSEAEQADRRPLGIQMPESEDGHDQAGAKAALRPDARLQRRNPILRKGAGSQPPAMLPTADML